MSRTGLIRNWQSASLQIDNASSLSGSIIHAGRPVVGVLMPEAWTAASLSFDVAACPGGTLYPLFGDDGAEIAIKASGCQMIANHNKLEKLASSWAFRIRSGCGVASAVDQGAARTFIVFYQG